MDEKRTVEDIIQEAVNVLNGLTVPVSLVENIGMPIAFVCANLKACLDAFNAERAKAEATAAEKAEE